MIKVQVSLTPNEAKRVIAKAVSQLPEVKAALENGRILLKGGTTVSALAEELIGIKMPISGRITQKGAKASNSGIADFHRVVLEKGKPRNLDSELQIEEVGAQMGGKDVAVCGANAIDVNRKTAVMVGRPLGGSVAIWPKIIARGVISIITVGWEKLIPCALEEALSAAGNQSTDMAMGMAVGLIPLSGTVVTETDAVSLLSGVKTTVIGAGGVVGGEGATTFVMTGERPQVKTAWGIIRSVKGAEASGTSDSLVECEPGCAFCTSEEKVGEIQIPTHRACIYFKPSLAKTLFSGEEEMPDSESRGKR